jgi:hypothetical protein
VPKFRLMGISLKFVGRLLNISTTSINTFRPHTINIGPPQYWYRRRRKRWGRRGSSTRTASQIFIKVVPMSLFRPIETIRRCPRPN